MLRKWEIDIEQLRKKVGNGAILVDVRSIQEYEEGHINEAIWIAEHEIPFKCESLLPDKNKEIIIYCQNGGRSRRAYRRLMKLGYKNVFSLCGGLDNLY